PGGLNLLKQDSLGLASVVSTVMKAVSAARLPLGKSHHRLVYQVPDGRLDCGGDQTADCALCNVSKGAPSLLYDHWIGIIDELCFERGDLGLRLFLLKCVEA